MSELEFNDNPQNSQDGDASALRFAPQHRAGVLAGVFDSGIGGLSVVKEMLVQQLPCSVAYVADQKHAPYGDRTSEEILRFSVGITRFLLRFGADIIVLACNTASAAALYQLRQEFPSVSFVGMEPAVKPAVERSRCRKVGVIATAATLQGAPYAGVVQRFAGDVAVITQVCTEFVGLVESGELASAHARSIVSRRLQPLLEAGVDELVLGCTHYSFLKPLIQEIAGPDVDVIDPAAAVARQAGRVLAAVGAGKSPQASASSFFTTGDTVAFGNVLQSMLNVDVSPRQLDWSN